MPKLFSSTRNGRLLETAWAETSYWVHSDTWKHTFSQEEKKKYLRKIEEVATWLVFKQECIFLY